MHKGFIPVRARRDNKGSSPSDFSNRSVDYALGIRVDARLDGRLSSA